jgi:hypothetical protein
VIVDALLTFVLALANGFLSLFPEFTLPASLTDLSHSLGATIGAWGGIFPVGALAVTAASLIVVRLFLAGLWLVQYVYSIIPFKFT